MTASSRRWGLTVPLPGLPLAEHAEVVRALPDLGYTDIWSAETNGYDAFTPLTLAAAWEPTLRLGTAIVPVFTRGPALIAMSAAALAAAAPGRFVLGLGASSPVIVGGWNGMAFDRPYERTRDVLRAVRAALAGERVDGTFDTFAIRRFRLEQPPRPAPPIVLAALRPRMLCLAAREADGAILNWLASYDVARSLDAMGDSDAEVVARIFVCPTEDVGYARQLARVLISSYLTVPAYAAFHDWLGRGQRLRHHTHATQQAAIHRRTMATAPAMLRGLPSFARIHSSPCTRHSAITSSWIRRSASHISAGSSSTSST